MKDTMLTSRHKVLGAKMAAFAGYNMPIQYAGINAEHDSVRNSVGVFDVSHMGEFIVKGKYALDLIQNLTSNDAAKLEVGHIQYSCLTNNNAGIVDDLLVYNIGIDEYMLVVNASNIQKDWDWINANNTFNALLKNISDDTSLLAVQGPNAMNVLQKLTSYDLSKIPYYSFKILTLFGIPDVIVSNTGYTGAGGFEIYVENGYATDLWDAIFTAGKEYRIAPIGLGARDTLRLEMGYCLYGNDINDETSPLEAGLGWITKFSKNFTAKQILEEQKNNGVRKKLMGFEMIDKGIPRHNYKLLDLNQNLIGRVTSGTQSPTLRKGIGMGYVDIEFAKHGTDILVEIRDQRIHAKISNLPFVTSKVK
jgi:aminomethyltransferase